ncbi:hypothetical protein [Amycolatopsis taiwanensis]|uniref:Uncharacterized protein n=1 Tax=Amycolatopsis taiwanensis TaxID=342230 RepID=A0A9W6VF03_9PSEU|nr:hypothetical protein [Amycolatopsis taiwanensis]GLY64026.1 hypothetical protein Atai01_06450 [Amycolatopsis taiwanensis]
MTSDIVVNTEVAGTLGRCGIQVGVVAPRMIETGQSLGMDGSFLL